MTAACDLLEAELALDHLEAALAAELPPHMRAFAAAYAANRPLPDAPQATRRIVTVQNALAHPLLADRALGLARLMFPIAIEDDRRVIAARARARTWDALAALSAARDAASHDRFGLPFVTLMHRLAGVTLAVADVAWPAPVDGWREPGAADVAPPPGVDVLHAGVRPRAFVAEHRGGRQASGALPNIEVIRADARARTFVVEPQRHVIVVAPPVRTPAERFALLHEYGHARVGLLAPAGVPRVVDEAAASFYARQHEDGLATRARARRLQLAQALDAIERGVSALRPTEFPPGALWHDPAVQAVYVEAEAIADRWTALDAATIARERARIDAATTL